MKKYEFIGSNQYFTILRKSTIIEFVNDMGYKLISDPNFPEIIGIELPIAYNEVIGTDKACIRFNYWHEKDISKTDTNSSWDLGKVLFINNLDLPHYYKNKPDYISFKPSEWNDLKDLCDYLIDRLQKRNKIREKNYPIWVKNQKRKKILSIGTKEYED